MDMALDQAPDIDSSPNTDADLDSSTTSSDMLACLRDIDVHELARAHTRRSDDWPRLVITITRFHNQVTLVFGINAN